ncbi:MAG: ParB/RepB/Spo0J family partition protein [Clostridia bacterium]|nr:ParB/RepB/Spo0J family partition protein [Clostridia bacterium]MDY4082848.1 ParB/RepB/Spo0J family partition protein [Eubacteriales bacterium]
MKKSGLGTGLEALLAINTQSAYDEQGNLNSGVEEVDIERIITNSAQPRKSFDQKALEELAQSIKSHGVIQPILVTAVGNKYQIVAGERRYRASKIAGLTKVPVIVKNLTIQQRKEIALIENIQRQDLNPIEEAYAYKSLIEEYGVTQEELAEKLGKSRPAITNALRLLTLNPVVIDMVSSGRLSAGHARCLASIKDYQVQASYAIAACDKQMSVRQLEVMVYNYLNPDKTPKKAKPVLTTELKDLVTDMQRVFGTKIKVVGNNTKGRICIDYFTQKDLERIFDIIESMKK